MDYDPHCEITGNFFASVQNKMHWAIPGHTAVELISQRADGPEAQYGVDRMERRSCSKGCCDYCQKLSNEF